jgi:hypothetical protein
MRKADRDGDQISCLGINVRASGGVEADFAFLRSFVGATHRNASCNLL